MSNSVTNDFQEFIKNIAIACHYANKQICEQNGDLSQVGWNDAPEWQKESAKKGVLFRLENPNSGPDAQHLSWAKEKEEQGWVYGETKDEVAKTHPCLVPYIELPEFQKSKDKMFCNIVDLLSGRLNIEPAKPIDPNRKPTLGEKRVRVSFNPANNDYVQETKESAANNDYVQETKESAANNDYVQETKESAARFIDLVNNSAPNPKWDDETLREWSRLKALSLTSIEEAAMWAVKAATI